tara:strand:+ start:1265 stop:2497 length:1233 start_codon:yes stop_codon:yes gene_type:complete
MSLLTVLLTVRLTTSTVGSSCKTAFDCSLNGVCNVATGVCACDAPWKDAASGEEACSVLDVLPHADDYVPAYGGPRTDTAYHANQTMTSWGGNILGPLEDGKFHMWVSAMGGGSGLDGWTHISEIHHATASDPMDAFTRVDTALPKEAHNASPLRAKNGSFLIFHIGNSDVPKGQPSSSFLHASESPNGPWRPLPAISCNNPAPMLHNNGTVYCGCNNGGFTIYRSDDIWQGKWHRVGGALAWPPSWGSAAPGELRNEDPYLWMDRRSNWHFLAHRYDYRDGWPVNPNQTMPILVSGHGFSVDGVTWGFNAAEQPYSGVIKFVNGTTQQFSTFERPHLLFNSKQIPTHLVNGVSPYWLSPTSGHACDGCDARKGSAHSCVVCKTTKGIDKTYTLVSRLNVPDAAVAPHAL